MFVGGRKPVDVLTSLFGRQIAAVITVGLLSVWILSPGRAALAAVRSQLLIVPDDAISVYSLPSAALVRGSDTLWLDGAIAPNDWYIADFEQGILWLKKRPDSLATLRLVYRSIGRLLATSFRLTSDSVRLNAADDTGRQPLDLALVEPQRAELDLSGDKSVLVRLGTGVSSLEQITNLSVAGSVDDWQVKAELSDRAGPIIDDEVTETLERIDQLFAEVTGRGWYGRVGDNRIEPYAGLIGSVARDVVGAVVRRDSTPAALSFAAGTPKGKYGEQAIEPIEGVLGPYRILVGGGSVRIVPGSEEVFFDGRLLVRGAGADYLMDYAAGEISFTSRIRVTSLSRIEVRFEYADDAYRRLLATGSGGYRSDHWRIGLSLFSEGDDPDASLLEPLSEEDKRQLGKVGADSGFVWLSGAQQVGSGNGDYLREGEVYRFVGDGRGDYRVRFTPVGRGGGDYEYDPTLRGYRFVGAGNGGYLPLVRVVLPQRNELALVELGTGSGALSVGVELSALRRSRNLFAADRGSINDGAGAIRLAVGDSFFGVGYERQMRTSGFRLPGTVGPGDMAFRWGGDPGRGLVERDILSLDWRPLKATSCSLQLGRAVAEGNRRLAVIGGVLNNPVMLLSAFRNLSATSFAGTIRPSLGGLRPALTVRLFDSTDYRQYGTDVDVAFVSARGGEVRAGIASEWKGQSVLHRRSLPVKVTLERSWFRASLRWGGDVWRSDVVAYLDVAGIAVGSTRFSNRLNGSAIVSYFPNANVRVHAELSQLRRQQQRYDELFTFVGPGRGDYERDSAGSGYFPFPGGSYRRTVVPTGEFISGLERSLAANAEVTVNGISLSGNGSATGTGDTLRVLRSDLAIRARTVGPMGPVWPEVGVAAAASRQPLLSLTGNSQTRRSADLRARIDLSSERSLTLRAEVFQRQGGFTAAMASVRQWGVGFECGPDVVRLGSARLEFERRWLLEDNRSGVVWMVAGRAEHGRRIADRTRIRLNAGVTWRRYEGVGFAELLAAEPAGLTPSFSTVIDHSFSERVVISTRYRFTAISGRRPDHLVELTASGSF